MFRENVNVSQPVGILLRFNRIAAYSITQRVLGKILRKLIRSLSVTLSRPFPMLVNAVAVKLPLKQRLSIQG